MIIPQYWAEARTRTEIRDRLVTVKRFGWSDESQAAAQRHAEERAADAVARMVRGESLLWFDHKVPYNGGNGLPIREEIVARHGETVITRNSYGALCLNTPDVLFADIDFSGEPGSRTYLAALVVMVALAIAAGVYWESWRIVGVGLVAGMVLLPLAAMLVTAVVNRITGGAEQRARARITQFIASHPDWRLRIYRTPAGLRLLAVHATFAPTGAAAQEFLRAAGSDPVYVRMCQNQECFRARLTAKPWRIGVASHMKPRPGVWPVNPDRLPERQRWIAEYEAAASGYAACRFEEEIGDGARDYRVEQVQRLHDDYARADSGLPIA